MVDAALDSTGRPLGTIGRAASVLQQPGMPIFCDIRARLERYVLNVCWQQWSSVPQQKQRSLKLSSFTLDCCYTGLLLLSAFTFLLQAGDTAQEKPGLMDKMKDMVTGHKPGHGIGKAGAEAQQEKYDTGRPLTEGEREAYGAPHTEKKQGFMEKVKEKLPGTHEHEAAKAGTHPAGVGGATYGGAPGATYPSTATHGATYTDSVGHPVGGPTSGEPPRKEGMMDKVKDKLHMGGQKDNHSTY